MSRARVRVRLACARAVALMQAATTVGACNGGSGEALSKPVTVNRGEGSVQVGGVCKAVEAGTAGACGAARMGRRNGAVVHGGGATANCRSRGVAQASLRARRRPGQIPFSAGHQLAR
jgi:hypothetical protein